MRQLLLSVLAAILVLVAQSFGPWVQSVHPSSQDRLNKLTPLMSAIEDAPSVEVLTKLLKATEMLVQSKQEVIDILMESKKSEVESLKESKKSEVDVWKKLCEEQDRTITKLEMELTTTMAENFAIDHTRIIIEHAAIQSKPGTSTEATMALSTDLFKDENVNSNKLCDVGNQWLNKLVYPDSLTPQLEKAVCTALRNNTFRTLSTRHHYVSNAPNGLYLGVGPNPDRYAQALLVLKAQFLGKYNRKVTLLGIEKKPIWILSNADVNPYQADSTDV